MVSHHQPPCGGLPGKEMSLEAAVKESGSREVMDHHTRGYGAEKGRSEPRKWSLSLSHAYSTVFCDLPSPCPL